MSFFDEVERRALEAEKISLQNRSRFSDKKIEWLSTLCPSCKKKVEYFSKEGKDGKVFNGNLKCGHCGKPFHLSRLTDFFGGKVSE